jgi:hypothetical protein
MYRAIEGVACTEGQESGQPGARIEKLQSETDDLTAICGKVLDAVGAAQRRKLTRPAYRVTDDLLLKSKPHGGLARANRGFQTKGCGRCWQI